MFRSKITPSVIGDCDLDWSAHPAKLRNASLSLNRRSLPSTGSTAARNLKRWSLLPQTRYQRSILECSNGQRPGKGSSWLRLCLPSSCCPLVLCAAHDLRHNKSPRPRLRPIAERLSSRKWETPQTTSPSN